MWEKRIISQNKFNFLHIILIITETRIFSPFRTWPQRDTRRNPCFHPVFDRNQREISHSMPVVCRRNQTEDFKETLFHYHIISYSNYSITILLSSCR